MILDNPLFGIACGHLEGQGDLISRFIMKGSMVAISATRVTNLVTKSP